MLLRVLHLAVPVVNVRLTVPRLGDAHVERGNVDNACGRGPDGPVALKHARPVKGERGTLFKNVRVVVLCAAPDLVKHTCTRKVMRVEEDKTNDLGPPALQPNNLRQEHTKLTRAQ